MDVEMVVVDRAQSQKVELGHAIVQARNALNALARLVNEQGVDLVAYVDAVVATTSRMTAAAERLMLLRDLRTELAGEPRKA
jgi:enamine deaminase RidA (YjgF/YER057c/UK114 family)